MNVRAHIVSHFNLTTVACTCTFTWSGEKTIFAGSSCFDLVTSDGLATSVISGHFDRKIRFWDTRLEKGASELSFTSYYTLMSKNPGFSRQITTLT